MMAIPCGDRPNSNVFERVDAGVFTQALAGDRVRLDRHHGRPAVDRRRQEAVKADIRTDVDQHVAVAQVAHREHHVVVLRQPQVDRRPGIGPVRIDANRQPAPEVRGDRPPDERSPDLPNHHAAQGPKPVASVQRMAEDQPDQRQAPGQPLAAGLMRHRHLCV